jgi:hypothetical protein
MSQFRDLVPDCRCHICGGCKHDHEGWLHNWTPKPTTEELAEQIWNEPFFPRTVQGKEED